jgi:hypothetical protein
LLEVVASQFMFSPAFNCADCVVQHTFPLFDALQLCSKQDV